jgi:predicted TIM-barrel fold metal-dependent hydrolase
MTAVDAAAPTDRPVVDTHAHVFNPSTPLTPGAWHAPATEATAEQYLQALDAHGIDFGVLAAASIFGTNNDDTLAACRSHPRLRTTVIVSPDCSLQQLLAMAQAGAVGVRFQWRNVTQVPDLGAPQYRKLLGHIAKLGWHVQLHDDSHRLPAHLPALESSGVKLVVDHFGRPSQQHGLSCPGFRRLLQSVERGSTWVKLSSAFRLGSQQLARDAAQALMRHAGPERLMWGSDWPFAAFEATVDYTQTVNDLVEWVPDAHARQRILRETPGNFYFA